MAVCKVSVLSLVGVYICYYELFSIFKKLIGNQGCLRVLLVNQGPMHQRTKQETPNEGYQM